MVFAIVNCNMCYPVTISMTRQQKNDFQIPIGNFFLAAITRDSSFGLATRRTIEKWELEKILIAINVINDFEHSMPR